MTDDTVAILFMLILNEITLLVFIATYDGDRVSVFSRIKEQTERIFAQSTYKLVDLETGEEMPDIPYDVEDAFYRMFLEHHNEKGFALTESYWTKQTNYWKMCGGSSVEQLRDMLARSEREGVTRRQNTSAKNSTRVLASMKLLRKKQPPPQLNPPTAKW
jgi:hypothetical protein